MSLRQLENSLGRPLFDRVGKRLLLNSAGHTLLPKAINIIDRLIELESLADGPADRLSGAIKVGCSLTVGNYLLPAYIARFKQLHPEVNFEVIMKNTYSIIEQVRSLQLDMAVVEGPNSSYDNLIYQPWYDDEMVVISRSNHPLVGKKKISYKDLEKFPWVLREEGSGTAALIEQHASTKFKLHVEIILTGFEAIKHYVANSNCLSCVSISTIRDINKMRLKILPVADFDFSRSVSLVINKLKYQSITSMRFKKSLFSCD